MNLLIIYHSGLGDDARLIFKEYAKQKINLTVVVPFKNGNLVYTDEESEKEFVYVPIKFRAGFNIFKLFYVIKKAEPDIIHVLDEYSSISVFQAVICRNIIKLLYGKKVPIFIMAMQNLRFDFLPLTFSSMSSFIKRLAYKIFLPFALYYNRNNIDGLMGGNAEAINNVKNYGTKAKSKLIFWGVDLSLFPLKFKDKCRENISIPKNIKLVGYFGKIIKEKGLEKLVKAIAYLDNYYLLLVGNGDYKKDLKDLVSKLKIQNRVYFYDAVKLNKLADYYNAIDVYVLPTQTTNTCKEQYGRVLVEAMSCGTSIVGSSCGAIPEVLHGYPIHKIFKEDSLEDLVNNIKVASGLRMPNGFDKERFLYKFSKENFVSENIKFYKEVLNDYAVK